MNRPLGNIIVAGSVLLTMLVAPGGCRLGPDFPDGLILVLHADRAVVGAGDTLGGRLVVFNTTHRHRRLTFPSSAQFLIEGRDVLNRTVFGYPRVAHDVVTYLELEPRGSHTYRFSLVPEHCGSGQTVRSGPYRLVARLALIGDRGPTTAIPILVW